MREKKIDRVESCKCKTNLWLRYENPSESHSSKHLHGENMSNWLLS